MSKRGYIHTQKAHELLTYLSLGLTGTFVCHYTHAAQYSSDERQLSRRPQNQGHTIIGIVPIYDIYTWLMMLRIHQPQASPPRLDRKRLLYTSCYERIVVFALDGCYTISQNKYEYKDQRSQ